MKIKHNKAHVLYKALGYDHCIWWLVRVTLVVSFGFLPQNFGRLARTPVTCRNDFISRRERARATFVKLSQHLISYCICKMMFVILIPFFRNCR